jgi:hypothetical protein
MDLSSSVVAVTILPIRGCGQPRVSQRSGYNVSMDRDPDAEVQAEVREQAAEEPSDETTDREELETALMDEDESEKGEQIGDEAG